MSRAIVILALSVALGAAAPQPRAVGPQPGVASPQPGVASPQSAFDAARKLQQEGKPQEAFLAYAAIPGAGHAAAEIARPEAAAYLDLLRAKGDSVPKSQAAAIEGDLLLTLGRKDEALAAYRSAADAVAAALDQAAPTGHAPPDAYLVEAPAASPEMPRGAGLLEPFTVGPGSHRDNWLLRRFIALDAWDDAAKEFARVWQIHRRGAKPYLVEVAVRMEGDRPVREKRLVRPAGFDGHGLQFALDYAYFLKRRNDIDRALAVLQEPLLLVDMDRNPNSVQPEPIAQGQDIAALPLRADWSFGRGRWFPFGSAGTSRQEFVRLAYGAFKTAGREEALTAAMERDIAAGTNRLRRVLAKVRLHQGKTDEALALELAYVQQAGMDPLTAAYRRGRAYEEAARPADAAAAYEASLRLPFKAPLALADADEEAVQSRMMSQAAMPMPRPGAGQAQFQSEVLARLGRLYGALGQADKLYETTLRQFEANPALLSDLRTLEQAASRAEVLGRQEGFRQWLAAQAQAAPGPEAKANLHWALQDYAACARALAESWAKKDGAGGQGYAYSFDVWRERFRKEGKDALRSLLETVVKLDPQNARARLELLDLSERFEGPEVIRTLETLLETDAGFAFQRGKGVYNRTRFRGYFDLAYRLMRLYEREKQPEKLVALGLRIAAGEKPFAEWWKLDPAQYQYRDENGQPEDLNACLALLVQKADGAALDRLEALWKDKPDLPARRQLARRRAAEKGDESNLPRSGPPGAPHKLDLSPFSAFAAETGPDLGWANLPGGVRLIASGENVLSLACDAGHVYAGHPWGVAVYDLQGKPVTRIALGEAARALAVAGGRLWAGTPKGLFAIDPGKWTVSHLWLHGDVPERDRYSRPFPGPADYWFDNSVYTLVPDGEQLWIGLHRNVQRLDTRTMTLRAYSFRELQIESWAGFDRILPDAEYVWADGSAGLRRYDRASDSWAKVDHGQRGVGLIGLVDGRLFGHVWLSDQLRDRPCLIDRKTLRVTPLLIEANLSQSERQINGPFSYYGSYRGKPVFGPGHPAFVLDETAMKLRPIGPPWDRPDDPIQSVLVREMRGGAVFFSADPVRWEREAAGRGTLLVRRPDDGFSLLLLPDGRTVLVRRDNRTRYEYPREDWPFADIVWDKRQREGGLWFAGRDGQPRRVSASPHADSIPGCVIFGAVPQSEPSGVWLCTDLGLAVLDGRDRVVAALGRDDGLCANRVTSGVALGGLLYFSTGWGDHGGGLAVFDPATRVLSGLYQSDGLATDKLAAIEPAGDKLRLVYDVEYGRGGSFRYRVYPPGVFDPSTGRVAPGGDPSYPDQQQAGQVIAQRAGRPGRLVPWLGGFVVAEKRIGPKTYVCGTRGLAVFGQDARPEAAPSELTVTLVLDPSVVQQEEARRAKVQIASAEDLKKCLSSPNPYLRAAGLAAAWNPAKERPAEYVPLLASSVDDPHLRPRATAVFVLSQIQDDASAAPLKKALADADPQVRGLAALSLARLGQTPPLDKFTEMLGRDYGNYPFGADSTVGGQVDRQRALQAIAPRATPEVFALLLKDPPVIDSYDYRSTVFPALGQSLCRCPEAAGLLLAAYDPAGDPGPDANYGPARFAQEVFKHAGKPMLPRLHEALASPDRVVRSNAARACGAIGQAESIPLLLKALDLESGLSRGSIVWALGELKAAESLARLAAIYVDARSEEKRRRGSGFLAAQAQAEVRAHYESIGNLESIAGDWSELKTAARPVADPRRNEPLLSPEMVLAAVRKIGPASSQEFYRKLAAEADAGARQEAAERLAEGSPADAEKNAPVLRHLMADEDPQVRTRAAVSLLLMGREEVQKEIVAWLRGPEPWARMVVVRQLDRVTDGRRLAFAREAVQKLAGDPELSTYDVEAVRRLLERMPAP